MGAATTTTERLLNETFSTFVQNFLWRCHLAV